MRLEDLKSKPEYSFLENPILKDRLILLCVSGSKSHGTDTKDSDIDIRGCRMPSEAELYGLKDKESGTYVDNNTDTTIYTFHRFVKLCCKANPNIIESLGVRDEDVLFASYTGHLLLKNRKMFLSKNAVYHAYGGFARRESVQIKHKEDNSRGVDFLRFAKQMMQLVRLLKLGTEILKTGDIRTYRGDDIELLMKIRYGIYLDSELRIHDGYWKLVDSCFRDFENAYSESVLPENVDMDKIEKFVIERAKKWK